MKDQTVPEKLEALVKLQKIDSGLDGIKRLRGDLPEEVQDMKDEIEGFKVRMTRFNEEKEELTESIKKCKEDIKKAKELIQKYDKQQNNVKNNREYNAITKELELQELEIQIYDKKIKESREKVTRKENDIEELKTTIVSCSEELEIKGKGLNKLLAESETEENTLLEKRKKILNKIEEKLLKYYERLRRTLSNGLAVVPVVRGAAQGCNIVIPPQKIAEIRKQKKIVIDEHSGRILASVDMASMETEKEKKRKTVAKKKIAIKKTATVKKKVTAKKQVTAKKKVATKKQVTAKKKVVTKKK